MSGYVRAQRDRFQHALFAGEKFCRGYAWDWMVARAAWKPENVSIEGRTVTIERGQFSHSFRFMAEAFGWSLGATQRFIRRLETDTMIKTRSDTGRLVITICNYDKYQVGPTGCDTPADTPADTGPIHERYTSDTDTKKVKKERREEEKNPPTPQGGIVVGRKYTIEEFERVWPHYPRRVGAANARKAWHSARQRAEYAEIAEPLKACIRSWSGTPPDKIPHFSTWLNRDGWLDDPDHAANRPRTAAEDIATLSRVTASDDIASLFPPHLRIAK